MNERSIITACRNGDRKAQKLLFDSYSKGMLLLCTRYIRNVHDAEEVMLNGFYKFFSTIDRFEYNGLNSIGGWLKKIMINECLMLLRKSKMEFIAEEYAHELPVEEDVISNMHAVEILEWIKELPDGYRAIFNLYVIEGYGHKEIAAMMGITEGTSKSQLSKARIQLQRIIKQKGTVYERSESR